MPASAPQTPDPYEAATDQAIVACDGDVRAALKAALIAMAMLESELSDVYSAVSHGFARGRLRGTIILEQRHDEMFLCPIGISVKKVRQVLDQTVSHEQSAPTIGRDQGVAHLAQPTPVMKWILRTYVSSPSGKENARKLACRRIQRRASVPIILVVFCVSNDRQFFIAVLFRLVVGRARG